MEFPQPGTIIPEDPVSLGQASEVFPGVGEFVGIGPVQADNDFVKVGNLAQIIQYGPQGRSLQLGKERHSLE